MAKKTEGSREPLRNVRLNQWHRDKILSLLLERRFDGENAKIRAAREELGDDIYRDVYPEAVRRWMDKRPTDSFLPKSDRLYVSVGGQKVELFMSKMRPVSICSVTSYSVGDKVYSADHAFSVRYFELDARYRAHNDKRREAEAKAKAAINWAQTSRQLVAEWPEVEDVVREVVGSKVEGPTALAIPVAALNEMLGLGKKPAISGASK